MLDDEYYVTRHGGKLTHFREICEINDDGDDFMDSDEADLADKLGERSQLVVVPIPFATHWFLDRLKSRKGYGVPNASSSKKSTDAELYPEDHGTNKKRNREMESTEPQAKQRFESDATITPSSTEKMISDCVASTNNETEASADATSDWWPPGFMESNEEECPVLAKIYYDHCKDASKSRRLRLNDVVELIGVVSVNPMQADFSGQKFSENNCSDYRPPGNHMFVDDGLFDDRLVLPPPSQLPRLHVLCYNLLDLDQLTSNVICKRHALDEELEEQPSILLSEPLDSRLQALNFLSSEPVFNNNKVVSEAVLLTLMSMAQRRQSPPTDESSAPSWDCVSTPTEDSTLGCASLNIQLPSESACRHFFGKLKSLIEDICPVVASIDLTLQSLNEGIKLRAPAKDALGRLTPNFFQLPKGSTILIHMGQMSEGTICSAGLETLEALRSLVQRHVVPYTFGTSMMNYSFEADYRVIVVSTKNVNTMEQDENFMEPNGRQSRSKLLPCAFQLSFDGIVGSSDMEDKFCSSRDMLKEFIASCRCASECDNGAQCGSNNVTLSSSVLEMAQKDFLQRRAMARKIGQNECEMAREEDFHRWLTLTRLEARSRNFDRKFEAGGNSKTNCLEATKQDWERALALDDAVRGAT